MTPPTDAQARAAGFLNAADMTHYGEAMAEELAIGRWLESGAPSPMEMWLQLDGVETPDVVPLKVEQAAARLNVSVKTVRRRLPALAEMDPPGAYRIGDGPRAPWRVLPAALERVLTGETVEPEKARPARGRRKTEAKKRSSTRWEA